MSARKISESNNTYSSLFCSPGCSYSDLSHDFCPASCTISCFSKCNQTLFCAPGCSYYDLDAGVCSSVCPSHCIYRCNIEKFCTKSCSSKSCRRDCPTMCCSQYSQPEASSNSLTWVIPIAVMSAV
jgi:hypothetical protein